MIMRHPRPVPHGPRTDDRIVLNIDLAPTIAELAGVVPPRTPNGMSLGPVLANIATTWRSDFLNEHWDGSIPDNALVKAVVDGTTWKPVEYVMGETELYNLDLDPFELDNVAGDPSDSALKATLATRLRQLEAE
jgi:arylsulfatase A-like enzyme